VEGLALDGGEARARRVPVEFVRTGMASVLKEMEAELTPTQVRSLLTTLVFVVVLLALIFRSLGGGFLLVLPLVGTILVNFGVMGYVGIGLDSFTAMVASIAIGLGIDYAIHFTHRYRRELSAAGGDPAAALMQTMATSGAAIMVNSLSVGLGFLVLLAAGGQHIRRFGGLTSLTMFVAAALTLTVLPALFLWIRPKFLGMRPRTRAAAEEPDGAIAAPAGS
jgi:predicted RND superfamily exporter protein